MQIHLHRIIPLLPESSCYFEPYECLPRTFDYSCPKSNNGHVMHLTQQSKKKHIFFFVCAKLTTMGHQFHFLSASMLATKACV